MAAVRGIEFYCGPILLLLSLWIDFRRRKDINKMFLSFLYPSRKVTSFHDIFFHKIKMILGNTWDTFDLFLFCESSFKRVVIHDRVLRYARSDKFFANFNGKFMKRIYRMRIWEQFQKKIYEIEITFCSIHLSTFLGKC